MQITLRDAFKPLLVQFCMHRLILLMTIILMFAQSVVASIDLQWVEGASVLHDNHREHQHASSEFDASLASDAEHSCEQCEHCCHAYCHFLSLQRHYQLSPLSPDQSQAWHYLEAFYHYYPDAALRPPIA